MAKKSEKKVEQPELKGNKLLEAIILKTYSRHALLSEEEFLEEIGFKGSGKSEEEAVRIAVANLLIAMTSEIFKMQNSVKNTKEMLKSFVNEDYVKEEEEK